ncbi:MAG: phasin family protein [bacterium]|nr:phasin family protein [bacterium]
MSDKKVRDELKESAHKIWLAGLGAMSVAEDEGSRVFKNLVEKGEAYEFGGQDQVNQVKDKVGKAADKAKEKAGATWERVEDRLDEAVAKALRRLGVPDRDEINKLTQRVEELIAVVEQLKAGTETPPQAAAEPPPPAEEEPSE